MKVKMIPSGPKSGHYHYTVQLSNSLSNYINLSIVLTDIRYENSEEEKKLLKPGIKITEFSKINKKNLLRAFLITTILQLKFFINNFINKPDIVHFQTYTIHYFYTFIIQLFFKIIDVKIIWTIHEIDESRLKKISKFEKFVRYKMIHHSDILICHNKYTKNKLKWILGIKDKKIKVIPHGNYLFFRKYMKKKNNKRKKGNILFFGIKKSKGIETFHKAIEELNKEKLNFSVTIAGSVNPPDKHFIKKFQNIDNVEIYPFYIKNKNIWKYFIKSDFVVMPYLKGSTSGAVHLAYSFKRPVISSDIPCFDEVVINKKTGLKVKKGDIEELKKAIKFMLENKKRVEEMGKNAYKLENSKKYDWNEIAKQTFDLYKKVI